MSNLLLESLIVGFGMVSLVVGIILGFLLLTGIFFWIGHKTNGAEYIGDRDGPSIYQLIYLFVICGLIGSGFYYLISLV